jgi:uncharacterized protein (DUF1778 family)
MVTKLSDGRGQVTIKGREVTDEWETLIRTAASRSGLTAADFIVSYTTAAAQSVLKGASAVPAAVPARLEDVADRLAAQMQEQLALQAAEQETRLQAALAEQVAALRRENRRGRWRR